MSTGINNVQQLLDDAITFDEPFTAHYIYFVTRSKKIELTSPVDMLYQVQLSDQERTDFYKLYKADTLQMRPIKLFAVQISQHDFAFYFSATATDVQHLHFRLFNKNPHKVFNAYEKRIDRSLYFFDTKQYKSFRELLKETLEFPKYICTLKSESR